MRKLFVFWVVLAAGALIAGCGGRGAVVDESEVEIEEIEGVAGADADAGASASGIGGDDATDGQSLDDAGDAGATGGGDDDLLNQRVIYFDYDSSILPAESEAVVQAHARYLQGAAGVQIILEGHADERGTREYNLALAEDRAKSVADMMQALGVGAGRIQTVSYGEERPVALGHDDSAWGLNRRVEFLYQ